MRDIPQLQALIDQQAELVDVLSPQKNRHAPIVHKDIIAADLNQMKSNGLRPLKLRGKFAGMHSARAKSNPRVGGNSKGSLT